MGLADSVDFLGYLSAEALPAFYNGLDMLVIPSRQEGFGIVGIEAMASGLPVIATRCGGPEDYVEDGVNGYLTTHDASEIAARILRLAEDRACRRRLAKNARETALSRYAPAVFRHGLAQAWSTVWQDEPAGVLENPGTA